MQSPILFPCAHGDAEGLVPRLQIVEQIELRFRILPVPREDKRQLRKMAVTAHEDIHMLLPYDEYLPETGVFMNKDGSLGAVFEAELLEHEPMLTEHVMQAVEALKPWFNLPSHCVLQVLFEQAHISKLDPMFEKLGTQYPGGHPVSKLLFETRLKRSGSGKSAFIIDCMQAMKRMSPEPMVFVVDKKSSYVMASEYFDGDLTIFERTLDMPFTPFRGIYDEEKIAFLTKLLLSGIKLTSPNFNFESLHQTAISKALKLAYEKKLQQAGLAYVEGELLKQGMFEEVELQMEDFVAELARLPAEKEFETAADVVESLLKFLMPFYGDGPYARYFKGSAKRKSTKASSLVIYDLDALDADPTLQALMTMAVFEESRHGLLVVVAAPLRRALRRFAGVREGLVPSQGGQGGSAPLVIFRRLVPTSLLAFKPQRTAMNPRNVTNERKNMNNHIHPTRDPSHKISPTALSTAIITSLILFTTGCASTRQHRKAAGDVLSQQNQLLRSLELERRDPNVLRRVRRDETLWRAEVHLREAIQALKESNEALNQAL